MSKIRALIERLEESNIGFGLRAPGALCVIFVFISSSSVQSCYAEENRAGITLASVEEAMPLAFKNNKQIKIQEAGLGLARADIADALSKFLPKVDLKAAYTHNAGILTFPQAASQGLKKDPGVFTGYENDNMLGISINESLYNKADIAKFRQSQLNLKISEQSLRAKKMEVEFEVKRLYYGLLLANETLRIAQGLLNQAESHYEDVQNKHDQGTSSRFDLLQSKVQVSKVFPEVVRGKNAVDLITNELKKILGLKLQEPLEIRDTLAYSPLELKEEEFLKQAYLNRPEMALKALGIDVSKWAIQAAQAGSQPQVNAGFNYSYRSNNLGNMFNARHNNWDIGVGVTLPIFDGFSTKAKVEEARLKYAQADLDKQDFIEQIALDIRKACLDLEQSQAIINSAKDNIEEAREALEIAEISYDNGEGTNLDILDAQVSLSQIKKNLSEAVYDYTMARAFLDRVMGRNFAEGENK